MRTISRLFDSHSQAASAVAALRASGVPREQITVVGAYNDNGEHISVVGSYSDETSVWLGPSAGMAIGATAGLLAGFGSSAVGMMAGLALVGAAWGGFAGGLCSILTDFGKKTGQLNVAQGVILVMARVDEERAATAEAVLRGAEKLTQPSRLRKTGAYTNSSRVRVQSGAE
ncbi:hypothetical protein OHD62_00570 [Mesorhizobium sp. YC-39]|uniref:hypothetical protein n=1 Tax=unclassified Mesorhizobium TaxID=325217 RepID=UPI0021E96F4C|nr:MULTISPECIES: hypothetical protein [unclassified Mesorhizobium]MCV3206747.1 hypothetical protein [Mesorhizobium sp. YC-2]MCV3226853.1 hypothetical protein [Mesorhizobium sp. YC-39]